MMTLKKLKTLLAAGLLMAALAPFSANAALVDQGFHVLDTDNNLLWVKLNYTLGFPPDQMKVELADIYGVYYAHRYATQAEIESLWTQAGLGPNFNIPSQMDYFEDNGLSAAYTAYLALTGETGSSSSTGPFQQGFHSVGEQYAPTAYIYDRVANFNDTIDSDSALYLTSAEGNPIGHYIVKDAPTNGPGPGPGTASSPSIVGLMLLGLAGLGYSHYRKK
jgi:nucleoside-specific outer membrane channel protein Tsx